MLQVDPERGPIAREMFAKVADGASVRSVSRWLGSLPADLRGGRACSFMAVRRLLSSRTYIGRLENGQRGNWEPLVDEDVFDRVRARLEEHRHMPRQASGRYLLTGLLRCPACSGRMSGSARGRRPACYRCASEELGRAAAVAPCRYSASVAVLDGLVLAEVAQLLEAVSSRDPALHAALRAAWSALNQPTHDVAVLVLVHAQAAAKARERIKRLALLFADGDIDREGYELGRAQAQADLEATEGELTQLRVARPVTPLPTLEEILRQVGSWRDILAEGDTHLQRDVLSKLIARVVPERIGYGKFRVAIGWSATGQHLCRLALAETIAEPERVA